MQNKLQAVARATGSMIRATAKAPLTGIRRLRRSTTEGVQVKRLGHGRLTVAVLIKVARRSSKAGGPLVGLVNRRPSKGPGLANKLLSRRLAGLGGRPGNNARTTPFRGLGAASRPKPTAIGATRAEVVGPPAAGLPVQVPPAAGLAVQDPAVAGLVAEDPAERLAVQDPAVAEPAVEGANDKKTIRIG